MRLSLLILALISIVPLAFGATISGEVLDFTLGEVTNAQITINTTPEQFAISTQGTYSFEVPPGNYMLVADATIDGLHSTELRNITIKDSGNYVIDLLLTPTFEEDEDLLDIPDYDNLLDSTEETPTSNVSLLLLFIIIVGIAVGFMFYKKSRKTNKDTEQTEIQNPDPISTADTDQVLEVLRKHGGRTTQKDIRKEIPLSEAKISLLITELEHKGKIEKIKKGRGNILVLKE